MRDHVALGSWQKLRRDIGVNAFRDLLGRGVAQCAKGRDDLLFAHFPVIIDVVRKRPAVLHRCSVARKIGVFVSFRQELQRGHESCQVPVWW